MKPLLTGTPTPPPSEKFLNLTSDFIHFCKRRAADSYQIVWLGGAVEQVTGYTQDEIIARGCWLGLVHPDDRQNVSDHFLSAKPGESGEEAFRFIRKDGSLCWVHEVFRCEHGEFPDEFCLYGAFKDITQRTEIEAELLERKEQLRIIADNTYDWEYWRAPDGKYLWVSPSCKNICGYSSEEFTKENGMNTSFIVHPEDRRIWYRHVKEVDLESPEHTEIDFRIIKRTGEVVWISHICKPIYSENRHFIGRRGCNRNITGRKLAEEKLKESEECFRSIIDQAQDAIFVTDFKGHFHIVNKKACDSLGYTVHELMNLKILDIDPGAKSITDLQKFWESLPQTFESRHTRKDGSTFPVEVRASKIILNNSTLIYGAVQDITQRKLDEELRSHIDVIIQHNLRTPAASAITLVKSIRSDENLTVYQGEVLELLEQSGQEMLDTLNSSLDLYKIETGQYQLIPKEFDGLALIRSVLKGLAPQLGKKGIPCEVCLNARFQ